MCSAAAHCYFESSTCVFSCDANLPFIFFLWNLTKCLISNGLIGFLALASGGWQLGKTMLLIWALIQLPLEPHTTMSSFYQGCELCLWADALERITIPDAILQTGISTDVLQVKRASTALKLQHAHLPHHTK